MKMSATMTTFESIILALQLVREREQEVLFELLSIITRSKAEYICIHFDAYERHFSPVLEDGKIGYASTKDNNCLCESIVRCLWKGIPRTETSYLTQTDEDARELAQILRQFLYIKPDLSGWREDLCDGEVEEEGKMLGIPAYCHLQKVIESIRGMRLIEGWYLCIKDTLYCCYEYSREDFAQELLWNAAIDRQVIIKADAIFASSLVQDEVREEDTGVMDLEEWVLVEKPRERPLDDILQGYEWVEHEDSPPLPWKRRVSLND